MDARWTRLWLVLLALSVAPPALAAQHATRNFVVEAPSADAAEKIALAAEKFRHDLAIHWLGQPLPNDWKQPCPITVKLGERLGAGGATTFVFDRGEVFGWRMNIQGSLERVLDSVLPHEVTHTIFATHFRQPLPRWADEGACTTVEHKSERRKQSLMLVDQLKTGRGIAFSQMFAMTEYPRDVMPLYSQGYSLVSFLLHQGGPQKFIRYLEDGLASRDWVRATREHYEFPNLGSLQVAWLDWVKVGSPTPDTMLAKTDPSGRGAAKGSDDLVAAAEPSESAKLRFQNPDERTASNVRLRPSRYRNRARHGAAEAGATSPADDDRETNLASLDNDAGPIDESGDAVAHDDGAESLAGPGSDGNRVLVEWTKGSRDVAPEDQPEEPGDEVATETEREEAPSRDLALDASKSRPGRYRR